MRNLIFRWAVLVCQRYDIKIENLTSSFSDGSAFLFLIHYYMPEMFSRNAVQVKTTSKLLNCTDAKSVREIISSPVNPTRPLSTPPPSSTILSFSPTNTMELATQKAIRREKENYRLLFQTIKLLDEIPYLVSYADMAGRDASPNETIVSAFLMYLFRRLIELTQYSKAAQKIQRAYSRYRMGLLEAKRMNAAITIQRFFRSWNEKVKEKQKIARTKIISLFQTGYQKDIYFGERDQIIKIQSIYRKNASIKLANTIRSQEVLGSVFGTIVQMKKFKYENNGMKNLFYFIF
jgi:hypothetical protein